MFKRRKKLTFLEGVREWVWPKAGWGRWSNYVRLRLVRMPGTTYNIAAGFACGAAISFTPFLGLHFIISAALAWIIRANMISAAIGTLVGNPWTFPLIWTATYNTGAPMMGIDAISVDWTAVLLNPSENLEPVFMPLVVGSVPLGIVVWVIFYFLIKKLIDKQKAKRLEQISHRAKRRQEKAAAQNLQQG